MGKKEVVEYIMNTPYNTNPTILNQKLDEMIAEEGMMQTVAMVEPVKSFKFVDAAYNSEVDNYVVVDYYNNNLHADSDEVVDAYFTNSLFARTEINKYVKPYFAISWGYPTLARGNEALGAIRYTSNEQLIDKLVRNLTINNSTKDKYEIPCCIQIIDGECINYLNNSKLSLTDVVKYLFNNNLYLYNGSGFGCPILEWSGNKVTMTIGTFLPLTTNFTWDQLIEEINKCVQYYAPKVCFVISGTGSNHNSAFNYFTTELMTADDIIENFANKGIYQILSGYQIKPITNITAHDTALIFGSGLGQDLECAIDKENSKILFQKYFSPNAPLILTANADNSPPQAYLDSSLAGDIAIQAIKKNRQILIRTPNEDGGTHTAIYSPVLTYQLPNYENDHLYLFYLRDEKQPLDLSAMGMGTIQLPVYGQIQMRLSNPYYNTPLE